MIPLLLLTLTFVLQFPPLTFILPDELRVCDAGWFFFSRVSVLGSDTPARAKGKGKAAVESLKTTADRLSRRTKYGSWKGTGGDTTIHCQWPILTGAGPGSDSEGMEGIEDDGEGEGMRGWRKILVYYNEDKKKTDWVMYEYRLEEVMQQVRDNPRAQMQ